MFNLEKVRKIYNLFKKRNFLLNALALFIIFLVVYIGSSIALNIAKTKSESRVSEEAMRDTIMVRGEGKVDTRPDIALISFGVTKESSSIAVAQQENVKIMNKINESLKNLGIKEDDLKTTYYSIRPRYEYNRETGKRTLAGYEVEQNLGVKIRDFSKIGKTIQEATKLGANQIGSLNFTIDDETKAKSEARAKAICDAKKKAQVLARQLGIKLGDIIDFQESGGYFPVYRDQSLKMEAYGGGEEAPMPDIEPGTNEITVNVELMYEIVH